MSTESLSRRAPPVHALAAFGAAARLWGFAPAAGKSCVTPNAVSHRIRQLEQQLDRQLFERTGGRVRLISADLGVAISPHRLAAARLDSGRLVLLTAASPRNYYVTCATPHQARPEVAGFIDWLRGCFSP